MSSAALKSAPVREAADRSQPENTASAQRARVRSASRSRTPVNRAPRSSAPDRSTNDQFPPSAFSSAKSQPLNALPVSLQRTNVASKKLQPWKVQFENAVSVNSATLKRTVRNVQPVNAAPVARSSVMSTSTNSTPSNSAPSRSRPYQSSPRMISTAPAYPRAERAGRPGGAQSWLLKAASKEAVGCFQSSDRM